MYYREKILQADISIDMDNISIRKQIPIPMGENCIVKKIIFLRVHNAYYVDNIPIPETPKPNGLDP